MCKGIKTVENYKGIRIEYAGIGFISAFDNILFDGNLEDMSIDTALKAERAYDELAQALPVPKCLKGGRTGLISFFYQGRLREIQAVDRRHNPYF